MAQNIAGEFLAATVTDPNIEFEEGAAGESEFALIFVTSDPCVIFLENAPEGVTVQAETEVSEQDCYKEFVVQYDGIGPPTEIGAITLTIQQKGTGGEKLTRIIAVNIAPAP